MQNSTSKKLARGKGPRKQKPKRLQNANVGFDKKFQEHVEKLSKAIKLADKTPAGPRLFKEGAGGTLEQVGREADSAMEGVKRIMQLLNTEGKAVDHKQVEAMHLEFFETRDEKLGHQLVEAHQHLASTLGRRMSRRISERDDVTQVAMIGLLKAVNRFDPTRGVGFVTFAWRTIEGEIKRYFRDSSWSMHVPRSLQERSIAVSQLAESLTQELGMSPSVAQIAQPLSLTEEEVVEVFELQRASRPISIDVDESDEDNVTLQIGEDEPGFGRTEDLGVLGQLLRILPERERLIVQLRFIDQLSQSEIATRVGLSQMHVSRLLSSSLAKLRDYERRRNVRVG